MDSTNTKDFFQINVYNHSGNHYRHLENQRNDYVKFYFTFIAASVTVIQFLPKEGKGIEATFGVDMILIINLILGTLIYAAIKKIGFALTMHNNVLKWLGNNYLSSVKCKKIHGIDDKFQKILDSRLLNTQLAMENSIFFILFIFDIIIIYSTVSKIEKDKIFINIIIWVLVLILLIFQFIILFKKNHSAQ